MKKMVVASDHRGGVVLEDVIKLLKKHGIAVSTIDMQGQDAQDDYMDLCAVAGGKVAKGEVDGAVLICGTGIGMMMGANRIKGCRAVLADSIERVYFARRHEDANILVYPAGYTDGKKAIKTPEHKFLEQTIIEFLHTDFEGDRHIRRIQKLDK